MIVLDSSCWLEYVRRTTHAGELAAAVERPDQLIVPSITLFEVGKKMKMQEGEEAARDLFLAMRRGTVVNLDEDIALRAIGLSIEHELPLADSIILATARRCGAELWTMDSDFKDLEGVKFIARK